MSAPFSAVSTQPCSNPECARPLEPGSRFCPFCAAEQAPAPPPDAKLSYSAGRSARSLVLRAGESVWQFEEPERPVAPGERRPLLVLDEQVVHLAHTDRHLTPDTLLARVQTQLQERAVPVNASVQDAYWQDDTRESRPRLVAALAAHAYSDVKALLGVDYLGGWASIEMQLAVEPEPLPEEPAYEPLPWPVLPWVLLGAGLLLLMLAGMGVSEGSGFFYSALPAILSAGGLGGLLVLAGLIAFPLCLSSRARQERERRERWEAEQARRRREKAAERLARTHKVADVRLFASAMRQVFQSVVDDIVESGGEIVREEGGHGGFFSEGSVATAAPTARRSDAARAAV